MSPSNADLFFPIVIGPETTAGNVFQAAGRTLRLLREERGMSQEDLAISCDYDQSSLSKVERRGLNYASPRRIKQIFSELGLCVFIGSSESSSSELIELNGARSWKTLLHEISAGAGDDLKLEFRETEAND